MKKRIFLTIVIFLSVIFLPLSPVFAEKGINIRESALTGTMNLFYGNAKGAPGGKLMTLEENTGGNEFIVERSGNMISKGSITGASMTSVGAITGASIIGTELCLGVGDCKSTWETIAGTSDGYIGIAQSHTAGGSLNMGGNSISNASTITAYDSGDWLRMSASNSGGYSTITWGDDIGDDLRFYFDYWSGTTSDKEVMRLLSNGNVGIGTTNPLYKLHIDGSAFIKESSSLWFTGTAGDAGARLRIFNTLGNSYVDYYNSLYFRSGASSSATRVTFLTNGNVGIGTTAPSTKLHVNGTARITNRLYANEDLELGGNDDVRLYKSGTRLHVRASDVDGVAEFTSYGLYLSRPEEMYNLYLMGSLKVGHGEEAKITINNSIEINSSGNSYFNGGNVGIGTTNPTYQLEVKNTLSNAYMRLDSISSGISGVILGENGSNKMILRHVGSQDYFGIYNYGHGGDSLSIDYDGNVGIGTTNPLYKLHIRDLSATEPPMIRFDGANLWGYAGIGACGGFDNIGICASPSGKVQLGVESANLTIISGGNVGIGTDDPSDKLDVRGNISVGNYVKFYKDASVPSGYRGGMGVNPCGFLDDSLGICSDASFKKITLGSVNGNEFTITGGNVGIGTTTPDYKLDVQGDIRTTDTIRGFIGESHYYTIGNKKDDVNNISYIYGHNNGSNVLAFTGYDTVSVASEAHSSSHRFYVSGSSYTSGTWDSSSDVRWKKDIVTLENSLDKIKKLRGVKYNWRVDEYPEKGFNEDRQIGLIAQEAEKVIPELVSTDDNGYKSVSYGKLAPILVEAIKEQQKQIEELMQKVEKLENRE